jgi:hypothetical protein
MADVLAAGDAAPLSLVRLDRSAAARGRVELSPRVSIEPGFTLNRVALAAGNFTTRVVSSGASSSSFTPTNGTL